MAEINYKELKAVCKKLNNSKVVKELKEKKVKTVGAKSEAILKSFTDLVERIDSAGKTDDIPVSVIKYYNKIYGSADPETPKKGKAKGKAKGKEKAEEKAEEKEEKSSNKKEGLTPRGCKPNSQSGIMDVLLDKGATMAELLNESKASQSRVRRFFRTLKKRGNIVMETKADDPMQNFYKIG